MQCPIIANHPSEKSSRSGSRHDAATMPADSPGFSIETTTMRLKSLKLRRAEVADQQDQPTRIKPAKSQDSTGHAPTAVLRAACVTTSVAWRCGTGRWPPVSSHAQYVHSR